MKKLIALAVLSLTLVGCSYSYNEMEKSRTACDKAGGEFKVGNTDKDGVIYATFCKIDGITYQYMRESDSFANGAIR